MYTISLKDISSRQFVNNLILINISTHISLMSMSHSIHIDSVLPSIYKGMKNSLAQCLHTISLHLTHFTQSFLSDTLILTSQISHIYQIYRLHLIQAKNRSNAETVYTLEHV